MPIISAIAISEMVRAHLRACYAVPEDDLRLVRLATDDDRFDECDRPRRRHEWRQAWGIEPDTTVALPIVQRCGDVEVAWIEPTNEGEAEPEHPAPLISIGDPPPEASAD